MQWNYKDTGAPKLSPEFREKHIVNIKGKEAVTVNGLIVLGHEKGIRSLKTKILQFPRPDNDNTCIVEATVVGFGYNAIEDKVTEVEFSSIGDANPKNCTAMVAAAFIRMAETRSIGRVLRNYTDIGMICSDEIGAATEEAVQMINGAQINIIAGIMKQNGITREDARVMILDTCKKSDLRDLTEVEAEKLITKFKAFQPATASA